jgi:hypothetical protein
MNKKFHTFFKTTKNAKDLAFGIKEPKHFNYVDFRDAEKLYLANRVGLFKQMNDSFLLEIEIDKKYPGGLLPGLKLTNQKILTWEDHWIDANSKEMVDPRIVSINLQKNSLAHANFNLPRAELTHLNLEGNLNLQAVIITEAPKLETLNMSNCPALNVINLGLNKNLKALLAKNCQLPPLVQERLLRDFTPTKTSSSNSSFNMFRKQFDTLLDMRGSEIDWGNRRIASKIRLLLCNNWMVLWDNAPPASIVPPQMYTFFTNSLEDSLIKDYYRGHLV